MDRCESKEVEGVRYGGSSSGGKVGREVRREGKRSPGPLTASRWKDRCARREREEVAEMEEDEDGEERMEGEGR